VGVFSNFRFAIDSELIHMILHPNRVIDTDDETEEGTNKDESISVDKCII
jgi:hypothetical protein